MILTSGMEVFGSGETEEEAIQDANRPTMGHLNKEKTMNTQEHPATAQQNADAAFSAAWAAARKNGGSFMHATDSAGVHGVIERHAPAEYAEYQRVLRSAQAALRGTKYEGAITS